MSARAAAPVAEEDKDKGHFVSSDNNQHLPSQSSVDENNADDDDDGFYESPQSAVVNDDEAARDTQEFVQKMKRISVATNSENKKSSKQATNNPKKSPLLLLLCASGITSCYLWYGAIQEHVFHMDNAKNNGDEGEGDNESITLFSLASGTFSSFLLAWIWTVIGPILLPNKSESSSSVANEPREEKEAIVGRLNHPLVVLTSLTYLTAMAASNESLHYVSYPTCVLAKSAKLIPTMVVGWIVDQYRSWRHRGNANANNNHGSSKSINATEWLGAALISIGILSFQYIQLHKQSNNDDTNSAQDVKPDSPFGLALLGLSLCMDGFLGACQSALKQKDHKTEDATKTSYRPPSAMETMLYINLYATLLLLPASHYLGQFYRGMAIMFSNSSSTKSMLLFQLNLSASLGQVFIFLTIHHFSPLTCTTITTTRKFFTILLSVYKFGHVLDVWQWVSIGLVFGGLYLEIVAKLSEQHHGEDERKEVGIKKKRE